MPHTWPSQGNLVFYWNRCYLGCLCITRIFENDLQSEDIRVGIVWKELKGEDYPEGMEILIITPNDSYWNMPWSRLQGNFLIIDFATARSELGIDVCVFMENVMIFFFVLVDD